MKVLSEGKVTRSRSHNFLDFHLFKPNRFLRFPDPTTAEDEIKRESFFDVVWLGKPLFVKSASKQNRERTARSKSSLAIR